MITSTTNKTNIITHEKLNELSDTECLVLYWILKPSQNWTYKEIALEIKMAPKTIQAHVSKLFSLLDVKPRSRQRLQQMWRYSLYADEVRKTLPDRNRVGWSGR